MSRYGRLVRIAVEALLAGLALAFVLVLVRPDWVLPEPEPRASYAGAVAASGPAVVSIYTRSGASGPTPDDGAYTGLGSGVILDPDGIVATNWHVVRDAGRIGVVLADGRRAEARLIGADPETELALLEIGLRDLPAIRLGRSDTLEVGDVVLAIGNAVGLSQTVTMGIVSATGRAQLGVTTFEHFIQTDAAINVGNSGGALVNTEGELVGINTAAAGAVAAGLELPEGIGFAIPVNLVRGVVAELLAHGRVIRGWLGVEPADIGPRRRELIGLPPDLDGIELLGVAPGSPAAAAGLERGDVLLAIDGRPIASSATALNHVAALSPGTRLELIGWRDGERFETAAVLTERPAL